MKIVVCPADYSGCGWYRMIVPYTALAEEYGHQVLFADRPSQMVPVYLGSPSSTRTVEMRSIFDGADIIVLQRQTNPKILPFMETARNLGAKIIMEFDDNFTALPSANPNSKSYGTGKESTETMKQFIRQADRCIVSTHHLAEEYEWLNPNISVCYNAIADKQFERLAPTSVTGVAKRSGEIRIGYAGSVTHEGDFMTMIKPLIRVMRARPQVKMVFIGHDMRLLFPNDLIRRCEFAGRSQSEGINSMNFADNYDKLASIQYYDLIQKADLDIHIAPLAAMTFNKSKSYLKLLHGGLFGVPVICTRFGPYKQYIDEAPLGQPVVGSCSDDREWQRTLDYFVQSEMFRREVGQANLDYVKSTHLMSHKVYQWQSAIEAVSEVKVAA